MQKIEAVGTVHAYSHGGKFLRLDAEAPLMKYESLEYYGEQKIIDALDLKFGEKVKITIEKIA